MESIKQSVRTRIWEVTFGDNEGRIWTSLKVVAPNYKEATKKAHKWRKGEFWNRTQNVVKIDLLAESIV